MKRRTILAHGVFDLLHSGHVDHLQQARRFGDYLIVSVLADRFVKKQYLINEQRTRLYMVEALGCVDEVALCDAPGPQPLLQKFKPYIYVRNDEYQDQTKPEYALCQKLGIKLGFTRTVPPHTSELIERIYNLKRKANEPR